MVKVVSSRYTEEKCKMKKPYIICHMMTSVLSGVSDYYTTLAQINVPTTVSGRVTAELEMAEPGKFAVSNTEIYGQEGFSKKADCAGYEVIVDTKGTLIWPDAADMEKPYLLLCF